MKKYICTNIDNIENRFYKHLKINEIYYVEEYLTEINKNGRQFIGMNMYDKEHKQILGGCGNYIYKYLKDYSIYRKERIEKLLRYMD